jgi:6,7-dimethyl-8-ribityllumazine synthase
MTRNLEGNLLGAGKKFAIVAARFNSFIGDRLTEGAIDTLVRHGVDPTDISVIRVPGAFELPQAAAKVAGSQTVDGVICLGCLIRGATSHFDYIASACTRGISDVGVRSGLPVVFGVLTTDTIEQAIERAGTKAGNKGADAALAALEMVNLYDQLGSA